MTTVGKSTLLPRVEESRGETNYRAVSSPTDSPDVPVFASENATPISAEEEFRAIISEEDGLAQRERDREAILTMAIEMFQRDHVIPPLEIRLDRLSYNAGSSKKPNNILRDIDAVFKPGTMTLILGPPGCGKTSLLKAAAGYLPPKKLSGTLSYDGISKDEFCIRNYVGYMPQNDRHLATLTVRETLEFSYRVNSGDTNAERAQRKTELLMHVLGLSKCSETIVGDAVSRGISGGEQKRVTLGETLAGGYRTLFLDEFSTGLDTSATVDITLMLRGLCDKMGFTVVTSLLQPPPEVYELFDNIIVLDEGQIIYNGPREELLTYFEGLGYKLPPRLDVADFLQMITTDANQMFRKKSKQLPADFKFPETPADFIEAYETSAYHSNVKEVLQSEKKEVETAGGTGAVPLLSLKSLVAQDPKHWNRKYMMNSYNSFLLLLAREGNVFKRDVAYFRSRVGQALVMGILCGTLFFKIKEEEYQTRINYIWYAAAFILSARLPQIPAAVELRAVFYRQQRENFFRSWVFVVANLLTQIPILLIEVVIFGTLTYWLAGLSSAHSGALFLYYLMILFLMNISCTQLFSVVVSFSPDVVVAQALGGVFIMTIMMTGGYSVAQDLIPKGWIWAYWWNPITYAFKALAQNEFLKSNDFDQVVDGLTLGERYLATYGVSTDLVHYWLSPIVLVLFIIAYTVILSVFMDQITWTEVSEGGKNYETSELKASGITSNVDDGGAEGRDAVVLAEVSPENNEAHETSFQEHGSSSLQRKKSAAGSRLVSFNIGFGGGIQAATSFFDHVPFTPATLSWENLSYAVDIKFTKAQIRQNPSRGKSERRTLLSDTNGTCRPGRMVALMGASGAGKTTLLDVLAGRKRQGHITGSICVNGAPTDKRTFKRTTAYVEQLDTHSPTATVLESLLFSASLRLPKDVPADERALFAHNVMEVLELNNVKDTMTERLSAGQRKRLSVGVELVANPSILFLDEPTSGLDSRAALSVVRVVKRISQMGRTICCTIHQPSSVLFESFDDLLLLHLGRVVYHGELGKSSATLISYFSNVPGTLSYVQGTNPATWMLEVIGAGTAAGRIEAPEASKDAIGKADYAVVYENSAEKKALSKQLESLRKPDVKVETPRAADGEQAELSAVRPIPQADNRKYVAPFFTQYSENVKRLLRMVLRTPQSAMSRLSVFLFMTLLLGTMYTSIKHDNIGTTTDMIAIYASIIFIAQAGWISSCLTELLPVSRERPSFYKERNSNYYSVLAYVCAWATVELPSLVVYATIFANLVYWLVGYAKETTTFLQFYLLIFLLMYAALNMALFAVALTPDLKVANLLTGLLFSLNGLFMGIFINYNSMSKAWSWFYWLDPLHYFYEGVLVTQFRDDQRLIYSPEFGKEIPLQSFIDSFFNYSFSYSHLLTDILGLAAFIVAYLVLFGVLLQKVSYARQ